ncbi:MAG: hypothetical protein GW911_25835 [Armatimonadetes bacterium]|nr:hypothetical protein [Armatimonadota bacterium]NCO93330.1 hypothetical protein [Armatimonadota bacterium]NCP34503.1 hypothetical protein [Armatimonadota bacterium]NDK15465.1 hypothetical protein [Armatimonadota bacterium]
MLVVAGLAQAVWLGSCTVGLTAQGTKTRIDAEDVTGGGGSAAGTQRRVTGAVEGGVGGLTQSAGWIVRAGVVPRLRNATLPPPVTVTLGKGVRLFGVSSDGVYPLTAGIAEGPAYLVRWNPAREFSAGTLKYEYLTAFETPSPTFSGALERGRGYWRVGEDLVNFAVRPPDDTDAPIDALLGTAAYQGWNMLSNPFLETVSLADQRVRARGADSATNVALGSPAGALLVHDSLWGYPLVDPARPNMQGYQLYSLTYPGALAAMPAGAGMWVRTLRDVTWVWRRSSKQATRADAGLTRVAAAPSADDGGWLVRLTAQAGRVCDDYNYFGVGAATRQLPNPPPAAAKEYVDVRFEPTGRAEAAATYASAILPVSRADQTRWRFSVDSNLDQENVVLAWPDLSAVPREVRLFLVDTETGEQTYMRTSSGHTYRNDRRAPRRFEIRAERNGAASLRLTGIVATPTRGGALEISYVLSQPAQVSVRVASPAGRTVGESTAGRQGRSGVNRLTWVPVQAGKPLPTGLYLLEVTARTDDGRVAKGLSTLRLGR